MDRCAGWPGRGSQPRIRRGVFYWLTAALALALALLPAPALAQRPGVTRPVTSGTADTATAADYYGFIIWRSATTGAKTQTLPGCTTQTNGVWISLADGQGNAATYPITAAAAAGTVIGGASAQLIAANTGAATLTCDGAAANWYVSNGAIPIGTTGAAVPLLSGNNLWTSQNAQPPCVVADAASVTPSASQCASDPTKGTATHQITIAAANHTVNLPSGLNPGSDFAYDLIHSIANDNMGFGGGIKWVGGPPPYCGGTVTAGCISQTAGSEDLIFCRSASSSAAGCFAPASPQQYAVTTSPAISTICAGSNTSCASASVTVVTGHTLLVALGYCASAASCTTAATTVASGVAKTSGTATVGSCVNRAKDTASHAMKAEIWRCPVTGGGTAVITASFGTAVLYPGVAPLDAGGLAAADDGVGNANQATGNSLTLALTGSTTQPNELLFMTVATQGANPNCAASAGWTLYNNDNANGLYSQYSTVNATGTQSTTMSCPANSGGNLGAALAAFK